MSMLNVDDEILNVAQGLIPNGMVTSAILITSWMDEDGQSIIAGLLSKTSPIQHIGALEVTRQSLMAEMQAAIERGSPDDES